MKFHKVANGHYVTYQWERVLQIKKQGNRWYSYLTIPGWEKDVLTGVYPTLTEAKGDADLIF